MTPLSSLTALAEKITREVKSPKVRGVAKQITADPALNEGVMAMMERAPEMRSPMTALLAGIAADAKARRLWEESLDAMWAEESDDFVPKKTTYPEVFIGAGLTGAVYCATRAMMGMPVPMVLEVEERAGGSFAVSRSATFYLNSRNRPGGLGIPGSQGSLNFLPNAPIQPSELGFEEYQVNADVAYAIRAAYALMDAKVITKTSVYDLVVKPDSKKSGNCVEVQTNRGRITASRVVVGTGIGQPRVDWFAGERLLSFKQFMRRLDQPFPFRDMGRVAVIGAGDSGKVVIEALTGQGPARHMSVAALDYPRDIVWYGQQSLDRGTFENCNRPRYKRLGTLFSQTGYRSSRVKPISAKVGYVEEGYDCVLVDGQPYDLAINCTGYEPSSSVLGLSLDDQYFWMNENETDYYGRFMPDDYGDPLIYFAGPAAKLPRSDAERRATPDAGTTAQQREQQVAAWRYTGRTAMLAQRT